MDDLTDLRGQNVAVLKPFPVYLRLLPIEDEESANLRKKQQTTLVRVDRMEELRCDKGGRRAVCLSF